MAGLALLEPYVRGDFWWQGAALCASVLSNDTQYCRHKRPEGDGVHARNLTKGPRADSIWFGEAFSL